MATQTILSRQFSQRTAFGLLILATTIVVVPVLFIILYIIVNGAGAISWEFLTQPPSQAGKAGGIFPAIIGTFYLMLGALLFSLPIGVLAGIYLTEYARDNWLTRLINMAILNLAGVPSIVYGLFGLGVFVLALHFGMSLLAASLTLACQALAMTITTSREAILAVPREYREGSLAVGATKWQTIYRVVLPAALPGILTGTILGISRAAGETAPIMFTAAVFFTPSLPASIFDEIMALPYHIYVLATAGTEIETTRPLQYGTALVLIVLVLGMNFVAIVYRSKLRKRMQ